MNAAKSFENTHAFDDEVARVIELFNKAIRLSAASSPDVITQEALSAFDRAFATAEAIGWPYKDDDQLCDWISESSRIETLEVGLQKFQEWAQAENPE